MGEIDITEINSVAYIADPLTATAPTFFTEPVIRLAYNRIPWVRALSDSRGLAHYLFEFFAFRYLINQFIHPPDLLH